ncbi:MAG: hypothetical protein M3Q71_02860 [Chloroflexota bacterium]|nr:hypothetical protein [Chloroflexota bacterium]
MDQGDGRDQRDISQADAALPRPSLLTARAVLWDMDGTLLDSAEYH